MNLRRLIISLIPSRMQNTAIELDAKLREEFDKIGKPAKYGTAGFRDLATHIPYIAFRVGAFVSILNDTSPSLCLGVVMSASHNKIEDNGVKITNFSGNMLEMHYESVLQKFVQEQDFNKAVEEFKKFLTEDRKLTIYNDGAYTFIGGDTRPSTKSLLELVAEGIKSQNGNVIDFGLTTTPQLQYYVYLYNEVIKPKNIELKANDFDKEEVRKMYWQNFSSYFIKAANYLGWKEAQPPLKKRSIDCANGVGGHSMPEFASLIKDYIDVELYNKDQNEFLNNQCGADYVKTEGKFPRNFQSREHNSYLSYDGDADRILFYVEDNKSLKLIDGDRQGTVLTEFYKRLTDELNSRTLALNQKGVLYMTVPSSPTIGFVQTYYANYSSSEYLKKQYDMDPVYAATGVKHLHEKAEHYDIGVYFEGNGHGTVIFNRNFLHRLEAIIENKEVLAQQQVVKSNPEFKACLDEFSSFVEFYVMCCKLANPSVGDAISNFLLFEIALHYLKMDYLDTLKLYTDLKFQTSKISVKNKEALRVTDIEDKVVEPSYLQSKIEEILQKLGGKKAFLRASGTENVLRLHVEAEDQETVGAITKQVTKLVAEDKVLN